MLNIRKLSKWYQDYISNKVFLRGYEYASGRLVAASVKDAKEVQKDMRKKTHCARDFHDYTDFDKGIDCALKDYTELCKSLVTKGIQQ